MNDATVPSWSERHYVPFETILGAHLVAVTGLEVGSETVTFVTDTGQTFWMLHEQDCCESVSIEDIDGAVEVLLGETITMAEESASSERQHWQEASEYEESLTWTFYRLATAKGYVTIRWFGSSNGFYGESASFVTNLAPADPTAEARA